MSDRYGQSGYEYNKFFNFRCDHVKEHRMSNLKKLSFDYFDDNNSRDKVKNSRYEN